MSDASVECAMKVPEGADDPIPSPRLLRPEVREEEERNCTVLSDDEERKQSVFIDHKYCNIGNHKTFNYVGKTFNILRNERGDVTGHEPQPSVKKPGTVTLVYFVYTQKRISLM